MARDIPESRGSSATSTAGVENRRARIEHLHVERQDVGHHDVVAQRERRHRSAYALLS